MRNIVCALIEILDLDGDDGFSTYAEARFTSQEVADAWLKKRMDKIFVGEWKLIDDIFSWCDTGGNLTYQAYTYEDMVFDSVIEEQAAFDHRLAEFEKRFNYLA